jgi:LmbE family N-acetylglucosaminyl deacetylase
MSDEAITTALLARISTERPSILPIYVYDITHQDWEKIFLSSMKFFWIQYKSLKHPRNLDPSRNPSRSTTSKYILRRKRFYDDGQSSGLAIIATNHFFGGGVGKPFAQKIQARS